MATKRPNDVQLPEAEGLRSQEVVEIVVAACERRDPVRVGAYERTNNEGSAINRFSEICRHGPSGLLAPGSVPPTRGAARFPQVTPPVRARAAAPRRRHPERAGSAGSVWPWPSKDARAQPAPSTGPLRSSARVCGPAPSLANTPSLVEWRRCSVAVRLPYPRHIGGNRAAPDGTN